MDEQTKQANQCRELGADLYVDDEDYEADSDMFGADPFDILAFKQEQGDH
jgi:hypothetical protein